APRALLAAPRGSSSSSSPPPPARPWSSASSGERPGGPRRRRPRPRPRPPRPRARKRPAGSGSRGEEEEEEEEGGADDGEAEEEPEEEEEEEEDLIDGFAIASFATLEALQKDASLQPPERLEHRLKHSGKRKRGGSSGATGEPGDSSDREPGRPPGDRARKWPNKRRRKEASSRHSLEAGYICDAESDLDERVSDDDLDPSFTVSTSKGTGGKWGEHEPQLSMSAVLPHSLGPPRRLQWELVGPGAEPRTAPRARPAASAFPPKGTTASTGPSASCLTPAPLPATPSLPPPPQPQLQLRAPAPPVAQPPPSSSSSSSSSSSASSSSAQLTHRPPTPSLPLPLSTHSFPPPGLRPPPPPHHPSLFSPGPTLPPPPPLLQVPGHPGASAANALSGEFGLALGHLGLRKAVTWAQGGGSARPLAFQFHQHNHQHQHTHQHTHQHFTPYPPGLLPPHGPHMFEKYPGKMEGLFRHNPYTAFPPAVPGLPPGLPPAVSFGSLQGAFQPKSTNPELPPRLGPVPSGLSQKGTQIPDHFRQPLRKPGKWCAMHVRVAYMILRHQEKMKGDSHKLDFRNDLLPCLPGPYGALPPGQELSHPASLFTATGAVHAAANPFTAAPGAHGPFLSPSTHIDPFGRPTSFASLAALSNGAFGGLGSPTFNSGAVFAQKESPGAPPAFASPPDPWGRLHRSPLAFPAWVRPPEAARTPGSDKERPVERREPSITKEEKDRDLPFSRPQLRVSPATPKARAGEEGPRPTKESVRVKEERKEEAAAAAAAAAAGLHLLFERPRPPPFLGPSPPDRCAGFLEPTWLAAPPRLARPPRFYEAGEELTGPGAVAAARLYGLEPAHPLLYSRLAPPPPPAAAPGTPHLLSKTPPGALLGAPPPLVPAPRPSSPPRGPGPARADR
uniref:Fibrosin n=1 Tax=Rhinopithecus bieti TaxID=61621 RepID=A0A2K6KVC0_RHIBE